MARTILVTGGAGFIGSHLVQAAVRGGDTVRVLDDLSAGSPDNLTECGADIELTVGDVRDPDALDAALHGVEAVVHLAAIVSVSCSFADPELVDDVNVGGSLGVLAAARRAGVARVVIASSAAVYGDVATVPIAESAPTAPSSPYGVGKLAVEGYSRALASAGPPHVVCLRYFNVYGPRQDPVSDYAGVVARFMACAATDRPCVVYGDGLQTRDFVFVDDVVAASLLALDAAPENVEGAVGGFLAVNVGGGGETSIVDLARIIAGVAHCPEGVVARPASAMEGSGGPPAVAGDRDAHLRFLPARPGDIRRSLADMSLATERLGYRPSTSLPDGLLATWRWWTEAQGGAGQPGPAAGGGA